MWEYSRVASPQLVLLIQQFLGLNKEMARTIGVWANVILLGGSVGAVVYLLSIRREFVNAAAWLKALFRLTLALDAVVLGIVLTWGLQSLRPPLLFSVAAAFVFSNILGFHPRKRPIRGSREYVGAPKVLPFGPIDR